MKVQIPDQLKADIPQTMWGRVLSATPVVMAVLATMLAGLSSSEMTRAQYDRSLAAQRQSKAGDQWSFFQAKRLRGSLQRNSIDLLTATVEIHPLDPAVFAGLEQPKGPIGAQAVAYLAKGEVPPIPTAPATDAAIVKALEGMEAMESDEEMAALLAPVEELKLEDALHAARDQVQAFDAATRPFNQAIERLEADAASRDVAFRRDFTVARLRYSAQRYEVEARLNQHIATLYELQVRKSNLSAERHHARSQRFFYGMLAAQLGVIIATFAIAARQRNLLWTIAAIAGFVAIVFAVWVYLYV